MGFMSPPKPPPPPEPPPPPPQVDDAATKRSEADRAFQRRNRARTALTGDTGLPDLGATRTPSAGGM